jgi:hypothetical protein
MPFKTLPMPPPTVVPRGGGIGAGEAEAHLLNVHVPDRRRRRLDLNAGRGRGRAQCLRPDSLELAASAPTTSLIATCRVSGSRFTRRYCAFLSDTMMGGGLPSRQPAKRYSAKSTGCLILAAVRRRTSAVSPSEAPIAAAGACQ